METAIAAYIAQGFVVSNRTPVGATMFKKKEFQIVWAAVGFFLCLLPLLIYLIVYASHIDQMVQIALAPGGPLSLPSSPITQLVGSRSDVGYLWWDGKAWLPIGQPNA